MKQKITKWNTGHLIIFWPRIITGQIQLLHELDKIVNHYAVGLFLSPIVPSLLGHVTGMKYRLINSLWKVFNRRGNHTQQEKKLHLRFFTPVIITSRVFWVMTPLKQHGVATPELHLGKTCFWKISHIPEHARLLEFTGLCLTKRQQADGPEMRDRDQGARPPFVYH
jgi:hypothetical protein